MAEDARTTTAPHDHPFESALAELLQAEERGERPDWSRVRQAWPELEDRLREYFRDRDHFARLAPRLGPTTTPAAAAAPPDLPPGSRFAGYEIVRELGRGGMGVVYLARQRSADRLVALKLIRKDRLEHLNPDQRREWLLRFRTEGQAAARVADDRVVTVYEVGAHDGRPFYSMHYVEGRSLAEKIQAGPLPNRLAADLLEQIARAVQAVHEQGVLHRDLKPHNILVDARGRPHVTDFGLAKSLAAGESLTHTGDLLGSPQYMSPEQAEDSAKVNEGTDVYGLGATLYALLTGRPPFQGATVADTLHQVKYGEPTPPRRLNPAVDRDLNTIVLKCLEKEPGRRFRSAAAMANELQRYLEGRPILSRPVGPPGRLWRWGRRNPAVAALCAAVVVLVSVAGALCWAYLLASKAPGNAGGPVLSSSPGPADRQDDEPDYLEDMRRAQGHINGSELPAARALLAKWGPKAGRKTDRRGWEWYFLDAQCRELRFSVRGHEYPVQAVAWSPDPDGERLASADGKGVVKIWNVADNKEVASFQATAGGVWALAWSPDGKYLAAATEGALQVWETATGKEWRPFHPADKPRPGGLGGPRPTALIWSPSPSKPRLALAESDGEIQVWDLSAGGDPLVLQAHDGAVYSAAWSPDGSRLASVGGGLVDGPVGGLVNKVVGGLVKVWDPATGKALPAPAGAGLPGEGCALNWSEDGKRVSVISETGEILGLDVDPPAAAPTRKLVPRAAGVNISATPRRYVWGPGSMLLASVELFRDDLTIWDAATGKEGFSIRASGFPDPLTQPGDKCRPAWDPSGRQLAVGAKDGTVQAWRVDSSRRTVRDPIRNASRIFSWSFDGRRVYGAPDCDAAEIAKFQQPPPGGIVLPPLQGDKIGPQIQAWDAITGEAARTFGSVKQDSPDVVNAPAESPDGKWLAFTRAGSLQLWPTAKGGSPVLLEPPPAAAPPPVPLNKPDNGLGLIVCWSPDGKRLAYSTERQTTIRLWDPDTRKVVQELDGNGVPLRSVVWSSDGKRLASAGDSGTVKVWDVPSGRAISEFRCFVKQEQPGVVSPTIHWGSAPSMLSWRPDGKQLAVAGEDETIRIRDVDANQELATLHERPRTNDFQGLVCAAAWRPDGKRLAAASPDGTIQLWDAATWSELLALPPAPAALVAIPNIPTAFGEALAWSPDGWQLGYFRGQAVTIWDATPEEGKPGR